MTTEPTCTDEGLETYTCDCGYSYTQAIEANGHIETAGGTENSHTKCLECGETLSSEHTITETVQTAATCTMDGVMKHSCNCGYEYTSTITATGHTEVLGGTEGSHSKCSVCGETLSSAHEYEANVTKEAGCTEAGETTHSCDCGYSYTTEIAATGHTEVMVGEELIHTQCSVCEEILNSTHTCTSEVTTEPTCTDEGVETYTCECGYTYTVGIEATGHTEVTGGTQGAHTKCSVCNEALNSTHSYSSEVTTPPTCTDEGVETYTCDCGYSYTQAIDPEGHVETAGGTSACHTKCLECGETLSSEHTTTESVQTAATCKTDGVMKHSCNCGYEYTSTITATGHTKSEDENVTTCTECGEELVMLNSTNFPDSNLLTYLTRDDIDTYGDDMLDGDELANITSLMVPGQVMDLTGVGLLSSMTQLDLSNNTACKDVVIDGLKSTSLTIVGNNNYYDSISITNSSTVTSIDLDEICDAYDVQLSELPGVTSFTSQNGRIGTLDITGCTNIQELNLSNSSALTELNANGCTKLVTLNLSGVSSLRTLEIENCSALTSLDISSSYNLQVLRANNAMNISTFCGSTDTLDFSSYASLTEIQMSNNLKFSQINLTSNTSLQKLVYDAMPMTTLDLSRCPVLTEIQIEDSSVTELDFSSCTQLSVMKVSGCSSLVALNISGCTGMTYIDISNTQLASIETSGMSNIETFICQNATNLATINLASAVNLKTLDVAGATQLAGSLDLSNHTTLEVLDVSGLNISSLDFINPCKDSLKTLKVNETQIASFSPTNYSALKTLECRNTQITGFSANGSTLEYIDISENDLLTKVNVEETTYVKTLIVDECELLAELYIWDNAELETVSARNNPVLGLIMPHGSRKLKVMDLTGSAHLATGSFNVQNCGVDAGSLTVIVTGTTLTDANFPYWDSSYMTFVNE